MKIALTDISISKTNPRQNFDPDAMDELASSIGLHGVLSPILLRATKDAKKKYALVAGERRFRAAKLAGLEEIPAVVGKFSDSEVVEIQLVENLIRADLHPLEEAEGYARLKNKMGFKIEKISERIGRSVQYVYDRLKLLGLTPSVKKMFLKGTITARHAILLSRLSLKDQARVVDKVTGGLFQNQNLMFRPEEDGVGESFKTVTSLELQDWIDENVKFDPETTDPMLFPKTADRLEVAEREKEKIVPITYDHFIQRNARDGKKVIGPRSWKRADGKRKSRPCKMSRIGVIVVGPGRGDTLTVCIQKKKCRTHWNKEQKDSRARAKAREKGTATTIAQSMRKDEERMERQRVRDDAARERWSKLAPKIREEVAERLKETNVQAGGYLGNILIGELHRWGQKPVGIPRGETAEDLVRYLSFLVISNEIEQYNAHREFRKRAKDLGVDLKKILGEAKPKEEKKAAPND